MGAYYIDGGVALRGEYRVRGAKNAALPIIAAAVCRSGEHHIYDCPKIADVFKMQEIISAIGGSSYWDDHCLIVNTTGITGSEIPAELMEEMRSSVFLLGGLLARCGEAAIYRPGGCKIGKRPIDIHINGLSQLGFQVSVDDEKVFCRGRCKGGRVTLPYPSVGATENLMMAALAGKGDTIIDNCAIEPEIVDLQTFLRSMGFQVYGAGTGTVFIKGKEHWSAEGGSSRRDAEHFVMADRIETATYMIAVSACRGRVLLRNANLCHVASLAEVLTRMGVVVESYDNQIEVQALGALKSPGFVATAPYPGYPTDCQPQMVAFLARIKGLTTVREEVFENRFAYNEQLIKMGADIEICEKNAIIKGVDKLRGTHVTAMDLRGGAALVIAGLTAEGRTVVHNTEHIDRGYEDFDKGIRQLGGLIERA